MNFLLVDKDNNIILKGIVVMLGTHTALSEINNCQCFFVYLNNPQILNEVQFEEWKSKFLYYNKAIGSNGIPPTSEYCYMEFKLDKFRDGFDFQITERT